MPALKEKQKIKERPGDLSSELGTTTAVGTPLEGLPPPPFTHLARRRWWFVAGAIALTAIVAAIAAAGLLLWPKASTPSPVSGLRATRPAIGNVVLTWRVNRTGGRPESFRVLRNGAQLAVLRNDGGTPLLRYTDRNATPGKTYVYSVLSLAKGGTSAPQTVRVRVPVPPFSAARLSGSFEVKGLLTAESGFTEREVGDRFTETWYFEPLCRSGACATRVTNFEVGATIVPVGGTWELRLLRDGARYTGTTKASLSSCWGVFVSDTIVVTLQVSRARMVNGEWTATAWSGTYKDTSPYTQLGLQYCPSSSLTASVRGS